jgi:pyrroloquinoline quinone biosynthesis protein D
VPPTPSSQKRSKSTPPAPAEGDAGVAIFARVAGAESSRFGDETVLLDPQGRKLRGLNRTGARVWELLDGARSIGSIAEQIAREFSVAPERALADANAFVHALEAKGLARRAGGGH